MDESNRTEYLTPEQLGAPGPGHMAPQLTLSLWGESPRPHGCLLGITLGALVPPAGATLSCISRGFPPDSQAPVVACPTRATRCQSGNSPAPAVCAALSAHESSGQCIRALTQRLVAGATSWASDSPDVGRPHHREPTPKVLSPLSLAISHTPPDIQAVEAPRGPVAFVAADSVSGVIKALAGSEGAENVYRVFRSMRG